MVARSNSGQYTCGAVVVLFGSTRPKLNLLIAGRVEIIIRGVNQDDFEIEQNNYTMTDK